MPVTWNPPDRTSVIAVGLASYPAGTVAGRMQT